MDRTAARSLLHALLVHLPTERWWTLRETEGDDAGVAAALGRPRAEIDALLVNAEIYQESGRGFALKKKAWESFVSGVLGGTQIRCERVRRAMYVANGTPAAYALPTDQRASGDRLRLSAATMPQDIIAKLKTSADAYTEKKEAGNRW